jgi:hypothetical protein
MNEGYLAVFLGGIIVVGIVLIVIIALTRKAPRGIDKEEYQAAWLAIENSVQNDEGTQQLAILKADKLLDKALKATGYKGETMAERMSSASRTFTKREAIWAAHKLRNRIAHEDTVKLNAGLTRRALVSFKQGLKDLGVL